jgi:hypothetical protein
VLKFSDFKAVVNLRNSQVNGLMNAIPELRTLPHDDLVRLLNQSERDIGYVTSKSLGYNLGMLLSEFLYLRYGSGNVNSLILSVYKSRNWDQSLREVLGVEKSQLYDEMAVYVLEQLNSKN